MKKKKTETDTEKRIQETSKNMAKQEKGITLVALVITIIIIIILATVTINMAFGDNGLIRQAELARDLTANSMGYETQATSNLIAYMNEMLEGSGVIEEPPTPTVPGTVEDAKPDSADDEVYIYEETTQISDASNDTMWIPGGFGIASDSATDIDDGVVITDGTNEFVWIPVSDADLAEMYSTTTPETASDTTLAQSVLGEAATTTKIYSKIRGVTGGAPASTSYREPDILTDTSRGDASTTASRGINLLMSELGYEGNSATVLKDFAQDMVDEYLAVFNSIKEYDGFYIGRYELTGTAENPTVQRHQPVLTAATSGANTWYGLKDACSKVVNGNDKDAQSYMIYGNQWDEVMDWLVDTGAKTNSQVNSNSSTWGNYSNSSGDAAVEGAGELQNSGHSDAWSANNIYDLAGNYYEFTQEANTATSRVTRGRWLRQFRLGCSCIRPLQLRSVLYGQ